MANFHYKNISDQDLTLVGIGIVDSGKTIDLEVEVHNPNLETVIERQPSKSKVKKDSEDVD